MGTKISIVDVNDYDGISEALIGAIKLIENDFHFKFPEARKILLKPNLLTTKKDACTSSRITFSTF